MKMFDADKTRMTGLPYGGKTDTGTLQTDGRTDGRTDRIAISISRVSVLTWIDLYPQTVSLNMDLHTPYSTVSFRMILSDLE